MNRPLRESREGRLEIKLATIMKDEAKHIKILSINVLS
jgi:hypothetical protein